MDNKNRLNIPAIMRQHLPAMDLGSFMITFGEEQSLQLYPKNFWEQYIYVNWESYYGEDPYLVEQARRRQEVTELISLDPQGRITIPKDHLKHAGIEKEVFILGFGLRIELWSPQVYEARRKPQVKPLPINLSKMNPYGKHIQRTMPMNPHQPGLAQPTVPPEGYYPPPEPPQPIQPNPGHYPNPGIQQPNQMPPTQAMHPGQHYYPSSTPQQYYPNPYQPGFQGNFDQGKPAHPPPQPGPGNAEDQS